MAEPAVKPAADGARDQSLGGLVSLAVSDVSQLIKCELDLAKLELKADVRRVGIGGVLLGIAAFVGCLVLDAAVLRVRLRPGRPGHLAVGRVPDRRGHLRRCWPGWPS